MPISSVRELFVHELSDAMSAEQQILKMLPELRKEALHPELTQALKEHEQGAQGEGKELAQAGSAEQQILKMLPELRKEALHPELTQALKEHEQETKAQIKNLEQVFKQIGEKPEETTCFGVKGLADEHQALHEEDPSPEMLEIANVSGAEKTEHYEIVTYTGLVQM